MKLALQSFIFAAGTLFASAVVHAQEKSFSDTGIVCIELYPCDEDGTLLPEYSNTANPCYEYFASQCTPSPKKSPVCEDKGKEITKLKKQIRRLKLKLSRSK